jgi:transcriptional regulator with XRE-family HTH domain
MPTTGSDAYVRHTEDPPVPEVVRLGRELRRLRMRKGMSQRELAHRIGLSAHSNVGDYERGRRIPPNDIAVACERALGAPHGVLQRLRAEALGERAEHRLLELPEETRPHAG